MQKLVHAEFRWSLLEVPDVCSSSYKAEEGQEIQLQTFFNTGTCMGNAHLPAWKIVCYVNTWIQIFLSGQSDGELKSRLLWIGRASVQISRRNGSKTSRLLVARALLRLTKPFFVKKEEPAWKTTDRRAGVRWYRRSFKENVDVPRGAC